jgi:serine/threonine-protein kinase
MSPDPSADATRTGAPESPGGAPQLGVPGRIGRYELREQLARQFSVWVYRGHDPSLAREVTVEVSLAAPRTPLSDEFLCQSRQAAALPRHPNLQTVFEVGTDGDLPYAVMRFAPETLAGLLRRLPAPASARAAAVVARKVSLGLSALHGKGFAHRDLTPANILYDEANREVFVAGFRLMRLTSRAGDSPAGGVLGTAAYLAPEVWRGGAAGPSSDLYALGTILFEMLTGHRPFTGTPFELLAMHCAERPRAPSSLRPRLDPALDAICLKALGKEPAERFPSARAFADALADYLRGAGRPAP